MSEKPKALIAATGPTGLIMAHELARDGIQCRLIDKAPHRAMESRAIAIHARTVETFEMMGLADAFLEAGQRIAGVNIYGESGRIAHAALGSWTRGIRLFSGFRKTKWNESWGSV
jgi:NADPH-dependent dioxygenase